MRDEPTQFYPSGSPGPYHYLDGGPSDDGPLAGDEYRSYRDPPGGEPPECLST